MLDINWSAVVGAAGGLCSALSFLPQMLKVRRQGGRDLSIAMLALLLSGAILWFAYGLINHATAVIVTNVAIIGLVSATGIMKIRFRGACRTLAASRSRMCSPKAARTPA